MEVQDFSALAGVLDVLAGLDVRVDLNGVVYRPDGHGTQTDADGDMELFPSWGWTARRAAGRPVACLTAEAQRLKHRGYPPRARDAADLAAIAHIDEPARFHPAVRPLGPFGARTVMGRRLP